MRHLVGLPVLVALGALLAALYASADRAAAWLGLGPLAYHLGVFPAAFALYLAGLWLVMRRLRSTAGALAVVLGFAALFRILVLWTPVYLSSDLYRYLWDGRVQLAGISPYRYPPAAPELASLRDAGIHPHINRPAAVTVYPPGAQWLFAFAAVAAPRTIVGWRALLCLLEVATIWLLLRILRRLAAPATAVLAYAWSPLVVFEGVQAGHMDLAVIPVVLLALLWRSKGSAVWAGVALGLAVLLKLYPAILALAWWRRREWGFPAAVVATVALGYLPYAMAHGVGALGFLPTYFGGGAEDFNVGLRALLTYPLGFHDRVVRSAAMGALFATLAAVLVGIGLTRAEGSRALWRATALAIGAYLLLVPTAMHPWYVLWMVPFLCVGPAPAWLFFSGAVTLSYVEYVAETPMPWWAWLGQWGPLYVLLLIAGYRSLVERAPGAIAVRPT